MKHMTEQSVTKLIQDRQNLFIETRTKIETEVDRFLSSLSNLDLDVKAKCGVVDGATCKQLLPALWEEPFSEETYLAQKAKLDEYISQVHTVCDEICQEAIKCLQS